MPSYGTDFFPHRFRGVSGQPGNPPGCATAQVGRIKIKKEYIPKNLLSPMPFVIAMTPTTKVLQK